jgi:FdhD protein
MEEETPASSQIEIVRYRRGDATDVTDQVAREEPLEVRLNGQTLVFLMRLPGDDVLLAAGFCLSEGLIRERGQIELIRHCSEGAGESPGPRTPSGESSYSRSGEGAGDGAGEGAGNLVEVRARLAGGTDRFAEARIVRTGCGGADLDSELDLESIAVTGEARFSPAVISRMPDLLVERQSLFRSTGGTHGAGIFDTRGEMLVVKEDVGRHNAVDKALGFLLLSGETASDKGMILSGRLSYEMVLKAARAGIPLVCSVSAPTALGVEIGRKTGVTLVGFLRGESFNVYSHPERIGGD